MLSPEEVSKLQNKQLSENFIKRNYPDLYNFLKQKFENISYDEMIYLYKNNLQQVGVCRVCGKPTRLINKTAGYRQYCCSKCSNADPNKISKQQQTNLDKYGVSNPSQLKEIKKKKKDTCDRHYKGGYSSSEIRSKREQTCLEKYNDKNFKNITKIKQTKLERYGDENYTNQEKREKTNMMRYGSVSPYGNVMIQSKSKETKLERYGDENYNNQSKSKETKLERYGDENYNNQSKSKETKLERYGDENYNNQSKSKETKLKRYGDENYNNRIKSQKTCLMKYGVLNPLQNEDIKNKLIQSLREKSILQHEELIYIKEDGTWICRCPHPECNKCEEKTFETVRTIFYDRKRLNIETCTKLLKEKFNSNKGTTIELFVRNILDKYNIKYEINTKNAIPPYEIDIFIPEKKIAIECNGVYWHSSKKIPDRTKHIKKFLMCQAKGIQLLTIWEDWVINKPQIVESILLSKLNIYKEKIYARKCVIKDVSNVECELFLLQNHIQGSCKSSIRKGLYYNNELVSVMTFTKKRGMMGNNVKNDSYELSRFCNKLNTQIIGGASKLFSNSNIYNIYSFSCNDISNGNLYKKLGFDKENKTINTYWYIDPKSITRYHRTQFSKSNIVKKGYKEKIDNSWTEEEVTYNIGLLKIYDSGMTKWIYTKKGTN